MKDSVIKSSIYEFNLPPVDFLFDLKSIDLEFSPQTTNSNKNLHKYISQRSKMLNMGIYLADFSYLSALGERNLLTNYMSSIKYLADELKIVGLFNENSLLRFRNNINNADSLYEMSLETHNLMVDKLTSTNRNNTLLQISIGGFIESFYLYSKPIEDEDVFYDVSYELENYQFVLNEYFNQAQELVSAPFLKETVIDLSGLMNAFMVLDSKTEPMELSKSDSATFRLTGGNSHEITYEEFVTIKSEVEKARNIFISLQ